MKSCEMKDREIQNILMLNNMCADENEKLRRQNDRLNEVNRTIVQNNKIIQNTKIV